MILNDAGHLNPALLGAAMVATFMTLIMTKRMSAIAALIASSIVFGLLAGAGVNVGKMMVEGVMRVTPTALMLAFAILYFAILMDAGLFEPLVRRVLATVGDDPLRISVGTVVLATAVSLDGDGTTTALVVITAMLPAYRRTGMNPLVLATLLALCNALMNFVPWGGPTARVASALHVEINDVFLPLILPMATGLSAVFAIAWWLGRSERIRTGWRPNIPVEARLDPDADTSAATIAARTVPAPTDASDARRPHLFWFNLVLTLVLLGGMVASIAPLPVLMMGAFAIALSVNYPRLEDQRRRVGAHAESVVNVVLLIFAAGAFTGVLNETGMADAMANASIAVVPEAVGAFLAPIVALASLPLTFFLSNDAYYFGVVPVLAEAAGNYGIAAEAIGRASLIGQPVHMLSPLLAPLYLTCGLLRIDIGEAQRFALKWAALVALIVLGAALLSGAIPLRAST
jgi:CitMHS family citrate-Mg2+:H+ or citrate-Ca2+:H+ symporter